MNWRKASYSTGGATNCIEVADGQRNVMIRDTKEHHLGDNRTVLAVSPTSWRTFVESLQ
jgi:hypothetical protein